jgi:hypothetical protein
MARFLSLLIYQGFIMLVVLNFCIDVDIIEVPDFIIKDLKTYRSQFSTWLSNPDTEHSY